MSPMKSGLVMALALAVSGGGHFLSAQRGLGGQGLGLYGAGPRLGENVAFALELRSELGLSDDQVRSLQVLQEGIQKEVEPLDMEIEAIRTGIMAGEVNAAEGLVLLRDLNAQYQVVSAPYRTEIAAILTPVQHQMLQGIMWETRPLPGQGVAGLGLGWAPGTGQGLGLLPGQGVGLGVGTAYGRGVGLGLGRAGGLGFGRGAGLGLGRGVDRGFYRGYGRGIGRGAGLGVRWWD